MPCKEKKCPISYQEHMLLVFRIKYESQRRWHMPVIPACNTRPALGIWRLKEHEFQAIKPCPKRTHVQGSRSRTVLRKVHTGSLSYQSDKGGMGPVPSHSRSVFRLILCLPLTADCCPSCGFSLLHGPSQVHLSPVHLPGHHAARGTAPRQPPLQDGPY